MKLKTSYVIDEFHHIQKTEWKISMPKITPEMRIKARQLVPALKDAPDCVVDEAFLLSKEIIESLIDKTSNSRDRRTD